MGAFSQVGVSNIQSSEVEAGINIVRSIFQGFVPQASERLSESNVERVTNSLFNKNKKMVQNHTKVLIESGADVCLENNNKNNILDLMCCSSDQRYLEYLLPIIIVSVYARGSDVHNPTQEISQLIQNSKQETQDNLSEFLQGNEETLTISMAQEISLIKSGFPRSIDSILADIKQSLKPKTRVEEPVLASVFQAPELD